MDMSVFYAAVVAVENGHVGEIEIAHQAEVDGAITVTTVLIRREARPSEPDPEEVTE